MEKLISEKKLKNISGGRANNLTMGFGKNKLVKTISNWFKH
ncbi:bacteriocin [Companilactobacillus kimchiensis]|nr:bacteriocin [Companilactobacillus kimchiensis]